jgi:hypothetical protein
MRSMLKLAKLKPQNGWNTMSGMVELIVVVLLIASVSPMWRVDI